MHKLRKGGYKDKRQKSQDKSKNEVDYLVFWTI